MSINNSTAIALQDNLGSFNLKQLYLKLFAKGPEGLRPLKSISE